MDYTKEDLIKINKLLNQKNEALSSGLEARDELITLQKEQIKNYEELVEVMRS